MNNPRKTITSTSQRTEKSYLLTYDGPDYLSPIEISSSIFSGIEDSNSSTLGKENHVNVNIHISNPSMRSKQAIHLYLHVTKYSYVDNATNELQIAFKSELVTNIQIGICTRFLSNYKSLSDLVFNKEGALTLDTFFNIINTGCKSLSDNEFKISDNELENIYNDIKNNVENAFYDNAIIPEKLRISMSKIIIN